MEAEGNLSDDSPPEVGLPLPCSLDPLEETFDKINEDLTVDPPPLEYPATPDGPSAKTATKRAWVEEVNDDVPAAKSWQLVAGQKISQDQQELRRDVV